MTREEAIEALKIELSKWEADCKSYHAVKEALPMAIAALENENALIDRVLEIMDKLYDTACDRYYKVGYVEVARNELRMCGQAVANLKGGE